MYTELSHSILDIQRNKINIAWDQHNILITERHRQEPGLEPRVSRLAHSTLPLSNPDPYNSAIQM